MSEYISYKETLFKDYVKNTWHIWIPIEGNEEDIAAFRKEMSNFSRLSYSFQNNRLYSVDSKTTSDFFLDKTRYVYFSPYHNFGHYKMEGRFEWIEKFESYMKKRSTDLAREALMSDPAIWKSYFEDDNDTGLVPNWQFSKIYFKNAFRETVLYVQKWGNDEAFANFQNHTNEFFKIEKLKGPMVKHSEILFGKFNFDRMVEEKKLAYRVQIFEEALHHYFYEMKSILF